MQGSRYPDQDLNQKLTPWKTVLPEKLNYSRHSPHFTEPEGSSSHSQEPVPILSQIDPVYAPIQPLKDPF